MKLTQLFSIVLIVFLFAGCSGNKANKAQTEVEAQVETKIKILIGKTVGWSMSTNGLAHFSFEDENGKTHTFAARDTQVSGISLISNKVRPNAEVPANFNTTFKVSYQTQNFEYYSGGEGKNITGEEVFIVKVAEVNDSEKVIPSISEIKIGDKLEGLTVSSMGYVKDDSHEIHLRGKQVLEGELYYNTMEEYVMFSSKSNTQINTGREGNWPLYAQFSIKNEAELKAALSAEQKDAVYKNGVPIIIRMRVREIRCFGRYSNGLIGAAVAEFIELL